MPIQGRKQSNHHRRHRRPALRPADPRESQDQEVEAVGRAHLVQGVALDVVLEVLVVMSCGVPPRRVSMVLLETSRMLAALAAVALESLPLLLPPPVPGSRVPASAVLVSGALGSKRSEQQWLSCTLLAPAYVLESGHGTPGTSSPLAAPLARPGQPPCSVQADDCEQRVGRGRPGNPNAAGVSHHSPLNGARAKLPRRQLVQEHGRPQGLLVQLRLRAAGEPPSAGRSR